MDEMERVWIHSRRRGEWGSIIVSDRGNPTRPIIVGASPSFFNGILPLPFSLPSWPLIRLYPLPSPLPLPSSGVPAGTR